MKRTNLINKFELLCKLSTFWNKIKQRKMKTLKYFILILILIYETKNRAFSFWLLTGKKTMKKQKQNSLNYCLNKTHQTSIIRFNVITTAFLACLFILLYNLKLYINTWKNTITSCRSVSNSVYHVHVAVFLFQLFFVLLFS